MTSWQQQAINLAHEGKSWRKIAKEINVPRSTVSDYLRKQFKTGEYLPKPKGPRILFLDIETKFMTLQGWGLFNQNFSLDQIAEDWSILSFSFKWYKEPETNYFDVTEYTEDQLLQKLHDLLNEADFVVAHNGRRFDLKKIRSRMITRGFKPYSPVRIIDTLEICKKEFAFSSNKLMYVTNLLCKSSKKSSHTKFAGHMLWKEFISGNPEAIREMREYNLLDVDSLEELYDILAPWSSTLPVFDVYFEDISLKEWEEDGHHFSNLGKYTRYRHKVTGQYRRGTTNLLTKEERSSLLRNIV